MLVLSLMCFSATATTLVPAGGNGVVLSGIVDPVGLTVHVFPTDANTPNFALLSDGALNPIAIVDPQPGTDPNQALIAASTVAAGEFVTLLFDFTTPILAPDLSALVLVAGAAPNGTVTDPALLRLLAGPSVWGFVSPTGPQTSLPAIFVLSSVTTTPASATPEPATYVATLAGLSLIAFRARRRVL